MIVTYKPENAEPTKYKFRPNTIKASEAEMIEKRAGCSFEEWTQKVISGSATARRVLLWHCMRRDHPALRWEDTPDFAWSEVLIERELDELERFVAVIRETKALTEEEREAVLEEVEKEMAQRRAEGDSVPTSAS